MSHALLWFAGACALLGPLAAIGIRHRAPRFRLAAIALLALALPFVYLGLGDLLGRLKPLRLEWSRHDVASARVVAAELREGEAIYLWLRLDGATAPRAYALPWSKPVARQLHRARRRAAATGAELRVRAPFAAGHDRSKRQFFAAPRRPAPPKTVQSLAGAGAG